MQQFYDVPTHRIERIDVTTYYGLFQIRISI